MRSIAEIRADLDKLSTTEREGWTRSGEAEEETAARRLAADVEPLLRAVAEYENCIAWNVTCKQCAHYLDDSIREHERADKAEALARDARRVLNERMEGARQEIVDLRTARHNAESEVAKWRARDGDPDQLGT